MKNVQAIFFDFDGVILESVDVKGWAFGELFKDFPEHVDEIVKFHYANGGMSRFDKFRHIYKNVLQIPLSNEKLIQLCDEFSALVYHLVLECKFVPGAMEFLEKYHGQIPFFIISGTPQDEITKIVKEKDLDKYFEGVFGSPLPKSLWAKKILEERNLNAPKVLFVGDAMSDLVAARDNGLFFVARVNDLEDDKIFKNKKVDAKINDIFDLGNFIV